jgi:hypothetical protein
MIPEWTKYMGFGQDLRKSASPEFAGLTLSGNLTLADDTWVGVDTGCSILFDTTNDVLTHRCDRWEGKNGDVQATGGFAWGCRVMGSAAYGTVKATSSGGSSAGVSFGYVAQLTTNTANVEAGEKSFAFGSAYAPADNAEIRANQGNTYAGALAAGYAYGLSDPGLIDADAYGAFARGYAHNGTIQATGSGSMAAGHASSATILASGDGAVAMGFADFGDTTQATGSGTFAFGQNVSATHNYAFVFGMDCSSSGVNSARFGWSANGGLEITNGYLTLFDTDGVFVVDTGATNGTQFGQTTSRKNAFFGSTPITQPTALTSQTNGTLTVTAPGTPDTTLNETNSTPWGFASQDEMRTFMQALAEVVTRVGELETKLGSSSGLGLIA